MDVSNGVDFTPLVRPQIVAIIGGLVDPETSGAYLAERT